MNPKIDYTEAQTRSFEVRAAGPGNKTISGLAVPYDSEILLYGNIFEKFAPGSISDEKAILRYGHREPIGKITASEDTPEGRKIEAIISTTARGDEVSTLIADGVLSKMSIGFYPLEHLEEKREDGSILITWTQVEAREYSVVEFPAYDAAQIESIRNREERNPQMSQSTLTQTDLDGLATELRTANEDLSRELGLIKTGLVTQKRSALIPFEFRSMGDYLHSLIGKGAAGKQEMATRAFEGSVIGDAIAKPGWLGVLEKRMTLKQEVTNLFTHTFDLPATGMTIEYGQRAADTAVEVTEQLVEAERLAEGNPAPYEIKSAAVKTYGGFGTMSLQAIERADVSLLDDLLYDQALAYGARIETVTREIFTDAVTANESTPIQDMGAAPTVNDWIDALLGLIDAYDQTPYLMDGLAVSPTVFAQLAKLDAKSKALQFSGAPVDHQGTITVVTGSGSFADLAVKRIPRWEGQHATGYSREAIRVKESPGAPLRLQDSSVVDLTKTFAVYGYVAHFAPKTGLLKPLKFS